MRILIPDEDLRQLLNLEKRMARHMSAKYRKLVQQRMYEFYVCDTLEDMRSFPGAHLEELKHIPNEHRFTVRLENPDRILFEPADDPIPLHPGGNVDWTRVTAIRILKVGDTHGH